MNDRDIIKLRNYICETYPDDYVCRSSYEFDRLAYSEGAASMILERMCEEAMRLPAHISGKESASPIDIIEDFLIDANYFAEICDDSRTQFIFTTARDEAQTILKLYLKGASNG